MRTAFNAAWALVQVALLSQRGRAMLRVCQYSFNNTILRAKFFLFVTSASDLHVSTIQFCSVVLSVMSSLAVTHTIHRDCV